MTSNSRNAWCAICGVTIESYIIRLCLTYPKGPSTYDPDTISDNDVEWLDQVHLLGYNPLAATRSKFYVSDVAIIGGGVDMVTETRTDPAFAGVDVRTLRVYRNEKGPERVVPFHWQCYKTLALYLTGTSDTTRIRKDYGDSNEAQKGYWECIPGQEYTVFSPQSQVQLKVDIAAYISGPEFEKPPRYHYEVERESNPLTALPETVVFGISELPIVDGSGRSVSRLKNSTTKNLDRKMFQRGDSGEPGLYFRSANFIRNWPELLLPCTLDLFWNSEGDLSGMAVTFRQDQRIFGHEPPEIGAAQTTVSFAGGAWIKGFVFHIHASSALRSRQACSWNYSSCKGITLHLTDGSEHTYGQDGEHLLRMPFAAAENMTIVGMRGTLTAATNGGHFSREPLKHRDHEVSCWNLANCMFKNLISPTDDLKLNLCKGYVRNFDRWHCLVPLNTLVLANNTNELSQIRSISAYLIRDSICFNIWNKHCCDVGNLRVTTDTEARYLRNVDDDGSTWPEQRWDTFHIDGPGGEIIEEVVVHHALFRDPSPKAVEICTNRGRSVIWGVDMERGKHGDETNKPYPPIMSHKTPTHLRPDDGFAILGFAMGCGKVFGRWHSDEYHIERSKAPDCNSYSRRLKNSGEDYIDGEDYRGPWTKEQYDRRNESTIHTGMSKFGIITKRVTNGPEQSI
ncbi:activator of stress 1 [Fusarium pseudocircinatum]|uniref:Activator of stress 1 n=1 Tax=Fusarium pseudocircinatum TaxID=56676 RepID=A0A8H5ULS4_9HYPO|nr:activator of stress 1 [Fusarium pseudocircinatum]